jgi:hypothetical protein
MNLAQEIALIVLLLMAVDALFLRWWLRSSRTEEASRLVLNVRTVDRRARLLDEVRAQRLMR